jgi:3-hydroxybutyrate dehydrogenase
MRLKYRVAVVTGAASGICREIARTFVRDGAKIAIADLARSIPRKARCSKALTSRPSTGSSASRWL